MGGSGQAELFIPELGQDVEGIKKGALRDFRDRNRLLVREAVRKPETPVPPVANAPVVRVTNGLALLALSG
jgi:hypothetical protein